MRKLKCEYDEKGCKKIATYECCDGGSYYCDVCAENGDYECDCQQPQTLIPIHKGKKK